ncbi:hypothetical protein [Clostridium sp. M14]|uniref:hypothetical protein n=1 Tax=Clostridium sp. M14 TaxID=2716311 RepID=UPI0013EEA18A|nr:hypothetical protein [Clostridium sp. M14]MBZ9693381.1 hypothetical protein [Clostridium sp. M14]
MSKLTEKDFTASKIMELGWSLEAVSTLATYAKGKLKSKEDIFKHLFNEAYGIGWYDSEVLNVFFNIAMKIYDIVPSVTKGYVCVIDK